jgi:hypothetical protein
VLRVLRIQGSKGLGVACVEGCDIERIKKLSESIDNLDPFSDK